MKTRLSILTVMMICGVPVWAATTDKPEVVAPDANRHFTYNPDNSPQFAWIILRIGEGGFVGPKEGEHFSLADYFELVTGDPAPYDVAFYVDEGTTTVGIVQQASKEEIYLAIQTPGVGSTYDTKKPSEIIGYWRPTKKAGSSPSPSASPIEYEENEI